MAPSPAKNETPPTGKHNQNRTHKEKKEDGEKTNEPKGYCQDSFNYLCVCGLKVTHEALRVGKVINQILAIHDKTMSFMPGYGLVPQTGAFSPTAGEMSINLKDIIITPEIRALIVTGGVEGSRVFRYPNAADQPQIRYKLGDQFDWSLTKMQDHIQVQVKAGKMKPVQGQGLMTHRRNNGKYFEEFGKRMSKMHASYVSGSIWAGFSVELAPAIGRQMNFVHRLQAMGWLTSEGVKDFLLQKSVARYREF